MAATDATVIGNLQDALGVAYDYARTKMWVTFNTENGRVTDDEGVIRVDAGTATVNPDGSFELAGIPIPGGSNPTSFQVKIHYDAPPRLPSSRDMKRLVGDFGWMTVTEDADLADLEDEQAIPPNYQTTFTEAAQAYLDAQAAIAGIDDTDSAVAGLANPLVGPLTRAAWDALYATHSDLPTLLAETAPLAVGSLALTRAEKYAYVVEPGGSTDYQLVTAGGDLLRVSDGNTIVAPVMFGAAGDGTTDDRDAVQDCWIWAGERGIPVDMQGLEYNCSDDVTTRSNLTIYGRGAVMYVTAWPATGGFVNNVTSDPLDRIQSNIRIYDLIFDGSKLAAPGPAENCNLVDFGRGASDVRVVNCTARYMRRGFGGGTGGGGFGGEQGLENVIFDGCIIHDCFRGVRVAGLTGAHADAAAQDKNAIGVVFRDLTIKNCSAAVFCHSIGDTAGDFESDLSVFDTLFDGVYIEDCGHTAWSDVDYVTYPSLVPQKSGVLAFAGAQNIRMRGVRVKLASGYTAAADWLGNSGYPAGGTNYAGAGLSGNVGALVWGWGRNIVIEDLTLDGTVDCARRLARCPGLGEIASTPPGRSDTPNEQNSLSISHVRGTALPHIVDGWRTSGGIGLDNAYTSEVVTFAATSAPSTAVVSAAAIPAGGLTSLGNLQVEFRRFNGTSLVGTAVQWLADTSTTASSIANVVRKDGYEFGGGYSSTGAKRGVSYNPTDGIRRSSQNSAASSIHAAFYNTNGLVGSISTNASATVYTTSSDARLKTDLRDFDGIAMLREISAYDFAWLVDGRRSYGALAQEVLGVLPDAVTEDPDTGMLGVDYSKIVPVLMRAIMQLCDEVEGLRSDLP